MVVIVSAHYLEDLDWLEESPYPVIISTNNPTYKREPSEVISVDEDLRGVKNVGREAACFLRYIVKYYDHLPEHIAFIHGHEHTHHHHYPGSLIEAIKAAKIQDFEYIDLNVFVCKDALNHTSKPEWQIWIDLWSHYFEEDFGGPLPHSIDVFNSCAQFIVSKKRILLHPVGTWKKWLDLVQDEGILNPMVFGALPWFFEYIWQFILGEPFKLDYSTSEEYLLTRFVGLPTGSA
jgi:hypothetical protein